MEQGRSAADGECSPNTACGTLGFPDAPSSIVEFQRPARSTGRTCDEREGVCGNAPKLRPFADRHQDGTFEESPVRILVGEDDPLIREFVVEALREEGYQVTIRPMAKTRWHGAGGRSPTCSSQTSGCPG